MSEEKLRALLAKARDELLSQHDPEDCCAIVRRIDAALAEPVGEDASAAWLPSVARAAVENQKRFAGWLKETQRERDEARAEVERLKAENAYQRGAEAMREAAARVVEDADDGVLLQCLADAGIREMPIPEDKP